MNASQPAARRHTVPALYLGSEGRPASDRGAALTRERQASGDPANALYMPRKGR